MAASFWLSAEALTLTLDQVTQLNDDQARVLLASMRWGSDTQQICPECGVVDSHYYVRSQRRWRCKHCATNFSVTSRTPFADCKIGCRKLLISIFTFIIHQKGLAALALRRVIGGSYKTSFMLLHKLREGLLLSPPAEKLSGVIEIDGAHLSGRKRKKRKVEDQEFPPSIPKKYQQQRTKFSAGDFPHHPNRRIVIVLRELGTGHRGAGRTVAAVCRSENARDIEALVRKYVEKGSVIRTDELSAYGNLKLMGYTHQTVNHSVELSTEFGINQNQAESYFSRLRRAAIGVYHRISPRYMLDYCIEMGWREDIRKTDAFLQLGNLVRRIFATGFSADWRRYCQGHHRAQELLFEAPPSPP